MGVRIPLDQAAPGVWSTLGAPRGDQIGRLSPPGESLCAEVVLNDIDPPRLDHFEIVGGWEAGFPIGNECVVAALVDKQFERLVEGFVLVSARDLIVEYFNGLNKSSTALKCWSKSLVE